MPVEIERKFLVKSNAWRPLADRGKRIRQGYIANTDKASVRVRIIDGVSATLTTKLPRNGMSRFEFEHDISLHEATTLLELCDGLVIDKTRYCVNVGAGLWEIDVFANANTGLVVAEIELADEEQPVALPDWLGPEVTGDPRYQNSMLVRRPYRTWDERVTNVAAALAAPSESV